ncbi:S-locus glycoprotein, partial [Parasponia andersonii]
MDTKAHRKLMLIFHFLCLFLQNNFSLGSDTISANQSLSGFSTIVSAGGVFVLGLFSPGNTKKYYLGIWYQIDPSRTVVWVANREKPVSFYSELRISDGNLVLSDSEIPIWSTNVNSTTSTSVQAVLLDSGNLVLNDGSNPSKLLWQSFDHPTHTLPPGSKIGYNKVTKTHQRLTSWKNSEDPSPGPFTLQLQVSDNSFVLLWNRSRQYWTSGAWNGSIFSLVPEMRHDYIFDFRFVENENESYFTYSLKNTSTITSWFVLDVSGQIMQQNFLASNGWNLFWCLPRQQCEVYAFCGMYGSCNETSLPFCRCLTGFEPKSQSDWDLEDYSGGCSRRTNLQCGNNSLVNVEKDKFREMPSMSLPENKQSLRVGSTAECESSCLSNCSCTAYAYDDNWCSIWTGDLLNMRQLGAGDKNGSTLYVRLAASEFPNNPPRNRKLYTLLFGILAPAVVTSGIACYVYHLRRKKVANKRGTKKNTQGNKVISMIESERHITDFILSGQFREEENKVINVPFVVLETILVATDNFSEANILGRGGFGPVYK